MSGHTAPARAAWWRLRWLTAERVAAGAVALMAAVWLFVVVANQVARHLWDGGTVLRSFDVVSTDEAHVVRGLVPVGLEEGGFASFGMIVVCEREAGRIVANLHFGPFPRYVTVQPLVRAANGVAIRFGEERTLGNGLRAGWHSPVLTETAEVAHFIDAAFVHGVWIANRHTAFRNGVPEDEIAAAKAALLDCAGGGPG